MASSGKASISFKVDDIEYTLFVKHVTWHEAYRLCDEFGGELVIPRDKDTMQAIIDEMADHTDEIRHVWIGGTIENGHWIWSPTYQPIPSKVDDFPPWCYDKETQDTTIAQCLNLDRRDHITPMIYGLSCNNTQAYVCRNNKSANYKYDRPKKVQSLSLLSETAGSNISTSPLAVSSESMKNAEESPQDDDDDDEDEDDDEYEDDDDGDITDDVKKLSNPPMNNLNIGTSVPDPSPVKEDSSRNVSDMRSNISNVNVKDGKNMNLNETSLNSIKILRQNGTDSNNRTMLDLNAMGLNNVKMPRQNETNSNNISMLDLNAMDLNEVKMPRQNETDSNKRTMLDINAMDLNKVKMPRQNETDSKHRTMLDLNAMDLNNVKMPRQNETDSNNTTMLDLNAMDLNKVKMPRQNETDSNKRSMLDLNAMGLNNVKMPRQNETDSKHRTMLDLNAMDLNNVKMPMQNGTDSNNTTTKGLNETEKEDEYVIVHKKHIPHDNKLVDIQMNTTSNSTTELLNHGIVRNTESPNITTRFSEVNTTLNETRTMNTFKIKRLLGKDGSRRFMITAHNVKDKQVPILPVKKQMVKKDKINEKSEVAINEERLERRRLANQMVRERLEASKLKKGA